MNIRNLRADEIECRVQQVKSNGCALLLYKDARCDMKILDETFGIFGWQRKHEIVNGNLFCTVSIWDKENKMWIDKQDVGTESNTEKEKGQASDAFKRACFNIGIGRELYSTPFIWINLNTDERKENNGKFALDLKVKFKVSEIKYTDEKEIETLIITDQNNKQRFVFKGGKMERSENKISDNTNTPPTQQKSQESPKQNQQGITEPQSKRLFALMNQYKKSKDDLTAYTTEHFKKSSSKELTQDEYKKLCNWIEGKEVK